jgi:hypothetical protein
MKPYKIIEPRRLPTFGLPTLKDINDLQVGDWVKLIFEPGADVKKFAQAKPS